jgi:hypothetical protein
MTNPTVNDLQGSGKYKLVYQLNHQQIREFVIKQISLGSKLIRVYMIYQFLMILVGLFFITLSVLLAFRGNVQPLIYIGFAIIFSFTLLILVHELLHVLAYKITGAPKVSIGAYTRRFIFYAEADRHVLNRNQFLLVALTPLVTIQLATLVGIVFTYNHPIVYFIIFIMSVHSLFCAGDIGMLDYFYTYKKAQLFTFDVKDEKKSYFYCPKDNDI